MAADFAPEEQTEPVPARYDRQTEFQRLVNEALAFENRLNAHVDPWLGLCQRLVKFWLYVGLAAFTATSVLSIAIFALADAPFWLALSIVASPILFAGWVSMSQGLATTCGTGVQGSEGLAHTCSELKGVLDRERADLEHAQEVGERGLTQYSNHSAVKALAELSSLRLKSVLVHARAQRRINVLNEICDKMLVTSRVLALVCPLALIALAAAAFSFPFLHAGSIAPWATTGLLLAATLLAVISLGTSLLPFVMVYRFVRMIQRKLRGMIESAWTVDPGQFDSTGPMTEQFEWILTEWEECKRLRQQVNSHMKSLARRLQGRPPSLSTFTRAEE